MWAFFICIGILSNLVLSSLRPEKILSSQTGTSAGIEFRWRPSSEAIAAGSRLYWNVVDLQHIDAQFSSAENVVKGIYTLGNTCWGNTVALIYDYTTIFVSCPIAQGTTVAIVFAYDENGEGLNPRLWRTGGLSVSVPSTTMTGVRLLPDNKAYQNGLTLTYDLTNHNPGGKVYWVVRGIAPTATSSDGTLSTDDIIAGRYSEGEGCAGSQLQAEGPDQTVTILCDLKKLVDQRVVVWLATAVHDMSDVKLQGGSTGKSFSVQKSLFVPPTTLPPTPRTDRPTASSPTFYPTITIPTFHPTAERGTLYPTASTPTFFPTNAIPTFHPTAERGTLYPSIATPTFFPTQSHRTFSPSASTPTFFPTIPSPTFFPTQSKRTLSPSASIPSLFPTIATPTFYPTDPQWTIHPTASIPTFHPTVVRGTLYPTVSIPTFHPTDHADTFAPSVSKPTFYPTQSKWTLSPTVETPTFYPTASIPTFYPTRRNIILTSDNPSLYPTVSIPTLFPTEVSKPPTPSTIFNTPLPSTSSGGDIHIGYWVTNFRPLRLLRLSINGQSYPITNSILGLERNVRGSLVVPFGNWGLVRVTCSPYCFQCKVLNPHAPYDQIKQGDEIFISCSPKVVMDEGELVPIEKDYGPFGVEISCDHEEMEFEHEIEESILVPKCANPNPPHTFFDLFLNEQHPPKASREQSLYFFVLIFVAFCVSGFICSILYFKFRQRSLKQDFTSPILLENSDYSPSVCEGSFHRVTN